VEDQSNRKEVKQALTNIEALASEVPGIVEISTAENTLKYDEGYTHSILVLGKIMLPLTDIGYSPIMQE
jgi:hypothetical protein